MHVQIWSAGLLIRILDGHRCRWAIHVTMTFVLCSDLARLRQSCHGTKFEGHARQHCPPVDDPEGACQSCCGASEAAAKVVV